jgi:hypothetical protein
MKTKLLLSIALFFCATQLHLKAEVPEVGDVYQTVIDQLGKPKGKMSIGDQLFLYFDRGSVVLKANWVIEVDVLSDEEWAAIEKERELLRIKAEKERAELLAKYEAELGSRIEEGLETKHKMVNSFQFQNYPAGQQVKLWRKFMQKYPEINVTEEYLPALQVYERALARKKQIDDQARKLAALEGRVKAAEQRAERAETVAREAANNDRSNRISSRYVYYPYYNYPRVIVRPPACELPNRPKYRPYVAPAPSGRNSMKPSYSRNSLGKSGTTVRYDPHNKSNP